MNVPHIVAEALRLDGWWLRSDIIWHKPNPLPESVTDRPTKSHEYIFLLTKNEKYFYDAEAVRERQDTAARSQFLTGNEPPGRYPKKYGLLGSQGALRGHNPARLLNPAGRNLRSVWQIATEAFPGSHFATMPTEIVKRCILAGTSEKGCCSVVGCGKPWVREIKKSVQFTSGSGRAGNVPQGKYEGSVQALSGDYDIRMGPVTQVETLGWSPSCTHNAPTRPCVVLDPFGGSGTTALVADRLGRLGIGLDLSYLYCELARARAAAECSLFLGTPAPTHTGLQQLSFFAKGEP